MKLSVIITNYNYARYVGEAIESALSVEWDAKEVIVVDDGSTDNSREVIESFGGRIRAIFAANGGQTMAATLGFAKSSGEIVIFLDSDDTLLPSVADAVTAVWHPGVAKVQYGMLHIDSASRMLGRCWPHFTEHHTPAAVDATMRSTGDYLASPTTGNAWCSGFLREVFPLPTRENGLQWFDMYLHKLAPYFGEVISLTTPQCCYRFHGDNGARFATMENYDKLVRQVEVSTRAAEALLHGRGRAVTIPYENEFYRKVALVAKRFHPDRYDASLFDLSRRYWRSVRRGRYSARQKMMFITWSLIVLLAPRPVAKWAALSRDNHENARGLIWHVRRLGWHRHGEAA